MHYILTENRIPDDYNTYLPYFQVVFIQINKSFNGTSYQITTIRKNRRNTIIYYQLQSTCFPS